MSPASEAVGGRRLLVAALGAVALLSCGETAVKKLPIGSACAPGQTAACADGLCVPLDSKSGYCTKDCSTDHLCPDDFACEDAGKWGLVCKRALKCKADAECPSGHRCDTAGGECYIKVERKLCSPCTTDLQCPDGGACFSVPATGERYCTVACGASGACPGGYVCREVPLLKDGRVEQIKQCVPDNPGGTCEQGRSLCAPCRGDEECGGFFDRCVRNVVSSETFCGTNCDPARAEDCPEGFSCVDLSGQDEGPFQCVPVSGTCVGFCDQVDERAQLLQCGLGRECRLAERQCRPAVDGRECAPCRDNDDCRKPGREANECVMNDCADCPAQGETFCAEPCPPVDGDRDCQARFGPGFACTSVGQTRFCVPQRGTCVSGLGLLGDGCATRGAADCVTSICLSYGKNAMCSRACGADADCGDRRQWRCCEVAGGFYDCSASHRNGQDSGPASGSGVCAPHGGLFGDDCSPGRPPCQSGTCLDIGTARLCTVPCGAGDSCPTDFVCRQAVTEGGGNASRICFPDGGGAVGSDCTFGPAACADRLCIRKDSGSICTRPCSDGTACPVDWACKEADTPVAGQKVQACLPAELQ